MTFLNLYIDGKHVAAEGERRFQRANPITGEVVTEAAAASLDDLLRPILDPATPGPDRVAATRALAAALRPGEKLDRVATARAIVMQPDLLLADEPTGNLDQQSGLEVMALLESLNAQGMTLLLVTHDPVLAGRSKRQLSLVDGRIVSDVRR